MDILKKARDWFKKEQPERELEDEDVVWTPPDDQTVRYRLMILWANYVRSYVEEDKDPAKVDLAIGASKWVLEKLWGYATARELEAHAIPFGGWSNQQVIDYSWSQQGGIIVAWALGLEDGLPGWDEATGFGQSVWELESLPDPANWRTDLRVRPVAQIEAMAVLYETCYWRLRCQLNDYVYKLVGRAHRLGTIQLAADGDLATTGGRSVAEFDADEHSHATSLLSERLEACNWLVGQDEDWDSVAANTIVGWLWDDNWREPA